MKILNFLKNEKWAILSIALTIISCMIGVDGVLLAEVTLAPDPSYTPNEGTAGLNTQSPGQSTTVSGAAAATGGVGGDGLIQPSIDENITLIATDETVLDTIMRKTSKSIPVNSFEVDHYAIDEKKSYVTLTTALTKGTAEKSKLTMSGNDAKLLQPNWTIMVEGVKGYDSTGTEETTSPLMLFVTGSDSDGMPYVCAINGCVASSSDDTIVVPAIPVDTKMYILANACSETQLEVSPTLVTPIPTKVFLQKCVMNEVVSAYFEHQAKRIPFAKAVIAEAAIKEFRRECNRTHWVGVKGKKSVQQATTGTEDVYFTEGLRWQFGDRVYTKPTDGWSFESIIALAKNVFTGVSSSKEAVWLMGKDLLESLQNIDFTKHKDVSMTKGDIWGIIVTEFHTTFGTLKLVHEPTLDYIGMSNSGGIFDLNNLVRYTMKNEETKEEDIQGREAKRRSIVSINALALKGKSHMWVDGDTDVVEEDEDDE